MISVTLSIKVDIKKITVTIFLVDEFSTLKEMSTQVTELLESIHRLLPITIIRLEGPLNKSSHS